MGQHTFHMSRRCVVLAIASCVLSATARPLGMRFGMDNHHPHQLSATDSAPASYVDQPKDHFSTQSGSWKQAYYVNDTYFTPGPDAPVFLCVGGEGPALDATAVSGSVHCNIAVEWLAETKALMLAVEHRYYGCHNMSACPYDDSMSNPLQYLGSRQALADLANFHTHAVQRFGLSKANKWVSFGGSYPGMLAGWFRVKYPELVHAAVASSLPSVGGSAACRTAIKDGHAQIGEMFKTTKGREMLVAKFPNKGASAADLASRSGQQNFAGFGVAQFPSQSNDPACSAPACSIGKICAIMTDTSLGDNLDRLASLVQTQEAAQLSQSELAVNQLGLSWIDYWNYQTCTEFGFYQTCEVGSECFYTQGLLDVEFFIEDAGCDRWNITASLIEKGIEKTNQFYGGLDPNATRIMWPNGDVDPWHALSILESPGPEMPTLMVSGASHHAWTHPSAPTDQPSVVKARQTIRTQVAEWLKI